MFIDRLYIHVKNNNNAYLYPLGLGDVLRYFFFITVNHCLVNTYVLKVKDFNRSSRPEVTRSLIDAQNNCIHLNTYLCIYRIYIIITHWITLLWSYDLLRQITYCFSVCWSYNSQHKYVQFWCNFEIFFILYFFF